MSAEEVKYINPNPITNAPWDEWEIDLLIQHIQDPQNAPWLSGWSPMQVKLMLAGLASLRTAPRAAEANSEWHGGKVESIPEYFTKPRIVEDLAAAHPVLLVRQMANEILRLRPLAPGGQNAALPSGEFTNRKPEAHGEGPAVAAPYSILADGDRLRASLLAGTSPVPGVAPAPAEVAEGAGEESLRQRVNGAVARGWCWKRNEHKEMDSDLASAIADEVMMALRAAPSLSIDFDLLQTLRMRCNYIINGYSDAKLEAKEMGRLIGEALLAKVREAGK